MGCRVPVLFCMSLLVGACNMYSASKTDQALGTRHGVDAWLDPQLEPLTGCAALNREWRNRGNRIRDDGVDHTMFAAAAGFDDSAAVFAARVRLAVHNDRLTAQFLADGESSAPLSTVTTGVDCSAPDVAVLPGSGDGTTLSVDASGALWAGEHRYLQASTAACPQVGWETNSAPDGMATVVYGGTAMLLDPTRPGQLIMTRAPIYGTRQPAAAAFLLPGQQQVAARVWFLPESNWVMTVPSGTVAFEVPLVSCHVYLVFGQSDSTDQARVLLFDLGETFNWQGCRFRDEQPPRGRLEGSNLVVERSCFWRAAAATEAGSEQATRVFPALAERQARRGDGS